MDYVVRLQAYVPVLGNILAVEVQHLLIPFDAHLLLCDLLDLRHRDLGCYFDFVGCLRGRAQVDGDWAGAIIIIVVLGLAREMKGYFIGCDGFLGIHFGVGVGSWLVLLLISSHAIILINKIFI